jgi:hemolysin type calcium-binding protein
VDRRLPVPVVPFDIREASVDRVSLARLDYGRAAVRMRAVAAVLVGWLLAAGVFADTSAGAMVEVRFPARGELIRYIAGPGERNDLTFAVVPESSPTAFRVYDPGATVHVGTGCVSEDVHTAVCTATYGALYHLRATLGDGDDVLHPAGFNLMEANGGPGNDVLLGGTWDDRLNGGGGTDELRGGEGADILSDGDQDSAPGALGVGPDVLDGGPGADEVTYRQRTRAVRVDLADGRPDGARNEDDRLLAVESVTGGKGNDRLAGSGDGNYINGGAGSNLLIGRGGDDRLSNASGRRVRCGRGIDDVTRTRKRTRVPPNCERVTLRLPRGASVDGPGEMSPIPHRKAGAFGFDLSCPQTDGYPDGCAATVRIMSRTSHRLLASARFDDDLMEGPDTFLPVRLTALGHHLKRDAQRHWATIVIRGPSGANIARTAWTIAF